MSDGNAHKTDITIGAMYLDNAVVARRAPRVWDEQAARDAARCAGDAVRHAGPDDHHERDAIVGEGAARPAASEAEAAAAAHDEGEVEQANGEDLGDMRNRLWGWGVGRLLLHAILTLQAYDVRCIWLQPNISAAVTSQYL